MPSDVPELHHLFQFVFGWQRAFMQLLASLLFFARIFCLLFCNLLCRLLFYDFFDSLNFLFFFFIVCVFF